LNSVVMKYGFDGNKDKEIVEWIEKNLKEVICSHIYLDPLNDKLNLFG
jgi:hypothetical protein